MPTPKLTCTKVHSDMWEMVNETTQKSATIVRFRDRNLLTGSWRTYYRVNYKLQTVDNFIETLTKAKATARGVLL